MYSTPVLTAIVAFAMLLASASAAAQGSRIWRCGNTYTNSAPDGQHNCKLVDGGNVTVVEGTRPAGGAAAPTRVAAAAPGAGGPRIDSAEQRARDSDARQILEAELKKAETRRAELLKEFNNGEPEKLGPETRNHQKYLDRVADLRANITRTENDIAGIQRELSRLGVTPSAAAATGGGATAPK